MEDRLNQLEQVVTSLVQDTLPKLVRFVRENSGQHECRCNKDDAAGTAVLEAELKELRESVATLSGEVRAIREKLEAFSSREKSAPEKTRKARKKADAPAASFSPTIVRGENGAPDVVDGVPITGDTIALVLYACATRKGDEAQAALFSGLPRNVVSYVNELPEPTLKAVIAAHPVVNREELLDYVRPYMG